MTAPLVDVVILTWNDGACLSAAVESTLRSEGVDVCVWVVDNGSYPPASVRRDPRVTLMRSPTNLGVAPGRVAGVALGRAQYVCLLDSDARLETMCLARLVSTVASTERCGMAVPVFSDQVPEASAGRAPTLGRKLGRGLGFTAVYARTPRSATDAAWDVDFGIGACQLFRRDVYTQVGGLDDSIFYGPEDVDFCLRLRSTGWRVVQVAGASCHHPARRRHRALLTAGGIRHAQAIGRHLWRHRRFATSRASGC